MYVIEILPGLRKLDGQYRSGLLLHVQLLTMLEMAGESGAKKTHLVYGLNTNFHEIKEYLKRLESQNLITRTDGLIFITQKGAGVLRYFKQADELLTSELLITKTEANHL